MLSQAGAPGLAPRLGQAELLRLQQAIADARKNGRDDDPRYKVMVKIFEANHGLGLVAAGQPPFLGNAKVDEGTERTFITGVGPASRVNESPSPKDPLAPGSASRQPEQVAFMGPAMQVKGFSYHSGSSSQAEPFPHMSGQVLEKPDWLETRKVQQQVQNRPFTATREVQHQGKEAVQRDDHWRGHKPQEPILFPPPHGEDHWISEVKDTEQRKQAIQGSSLRHGEMPSSGTLGSVATKETVQVLAAAAQAGQASTLVALQQWLGRELVSHDTHVARHSQQRSLLPSSQLDLHPPPTKEELRASGPLSSVGPPVRMLRPSSTVVPSSELSAMQMKHAMPVHVPPANNTMQRPISPPPAAIRPPEMQGFTAGSRLSGAAAVGPRVHRDPSAQLTLAARGGPGWAAVGNSGSLPTTQTSSQLIPKTTQPVPVPLYSRPGAQAPFAQPPSQRSARPSTVPIPGAIVTDEQMRLLRAQIAIFQKLERWQRSGGKHISEDDLRAIGLARQPFGTTQPSPPAAPRAPPQAVSQPPPHRAQPPRVLAAPPNTAYHLVQPTPSRFTQGDLGLARGPDVGSGRGPPSLGHAPPGKPAAAPQVMGLPQPVGLPIRPVPGSPQLVSTQSLQPRPGLHHLQPVAGLQSLAPAPGASPVPALPQPLPLPRFQPLQKVAGLQPVPSLRQPGPASVATPPPPAWVAPAIRLYRGPLMDAIPSGGRGEAAETRPGQVGVPGWTFWMAYDVGRLLERELVDEVKRDRRRELEVLEGLLRDGPGGRRKRLPREASVKLRIHQRKLRLMELQARVREELEKEQREIAKMPERVYRKFGRTAERQLQEMARQHVLQQKVAREQLYKAAAVQRRKVMDAAWFVRDARSQRNKAVARFHEKLARDWTKKKDEDRTRRMDALKANDVDQYRRLLEEQQKTSMPGDANERFQVLSDFLSETEEYLHKLGGKVAAVKAQQEREEAVLAAIAAARARGASDVEAELEGREAAKQLEADMDGIDKDATGTAVVTKYYSLAHSVHEQVLRQPSLLRGGQLRTYQVVGLQWMLSLYNNKLNGILADEMGLGKTVQVMALLAHLMEHKGNRGPHLIIVPNAVIVNWKSEFNRWLPAANVVIYVGGKDQRQRLFQQEVLSLRFNVLVTTYEFIMRDRARLSRVDWRYVIIDEAQRMKDRDSRLSRDLDRFRTQRRLLLTGTPLQNDLHELWSLLNLLLPEVFDNSKQFHEWFHSPFKDKGGGMLEPIAEQQVGGGGNEADEWLELEKKVIVINRLHQILEPFMLRRRVEDVEGSLPPKVSHVVHCKMSGYQAAIYDWVRATGTLRLNPSDEAARVRGTRQVAREYAQLQNKCMELRKVCNHPYLTYHNRQLTVDSGVVRTCGKLWVLDRILLKLHRTGHRVLLFSTMTRLLDIVEDYLRWRGFLFRRIDGATSLEDRESAIDDFNRPGSDCFVFLLSIRAAGRGLNLQTADTVVVFDPDPNPKNEEQAIARAHRIGQTREVRVLLLEAVVNSPPTYALGSNEGVSRGGHAPTECVGSVESLVRNNIQQHKIDMADEVINAGRFDQRTTHEERRMTLDALLHDEDRYLLAVPSVPTLEEVNRMIARTPEELELFNQMDEEEEWPGPLTTLGECPKWLRPSQAQVEAAVTATAKPPRRGAVVAGVRGAVRAGANTGVDEQEGRMGRGQRVGRGVRMAQWKLSEMEAEDGSSMDGVVGDEEEGAPSYWEGEDADEAIQDVEEEEGRVQDIVEELGAVEEEEGGELVEGRRGGHERGEEVVADVASEDDGEVEETAAEAGTGEETEDGEAEVERGIEGVTHEDDQDVEGQEEEDDREEEGEIADKEGTGELQEESSLLGGMEQVGTEGESSREEPDEETETMEEGPGFRRPRWKQHAEQQVRGYGKGGEEEIWAGLGKRKRMAVVVTPLDSQRAAGRRRGVQPGKGEGQHDEEVKGREGRLQDDEDAEEGHGWHDVEEMGGRLRGAKVEQGWQREGGSRGRERSEGMVFLDEESRHASFGGNPWDAHMNLRDAYTNLQDLQQPPSDAVEAVADEVDLEEGEILEDGQIASDQEEGPSAQDLSRQSVTVNKAWFDDIGDGQEVGKPRLEPGHPNQWQSEDGWHERQDGGAHGADDERHCWGDRADEGRHFALPQHGAPGKPGARRGSRRSHQAGVTDDFPSSGYRRPTGSPTQRHRSQHQGSELTVGDRTRCSNVLERLSVAVDGKGRLLVETLLHIPLRTRHPEYYRVISDPVDVAAMRARLGHGRYQSVEGFAADLHLMFSNAQTWHKKDEVALADLRRLQKVTLQRLGLAFPELDVGAFEEGGPLGTVPGSQTVEPRTVLPGRSDRGGEDERAGKGIRDGQVKTRRGRGRGSHGGRGPNGGTGDERGRPLRCQAAGLERRGSRGGGPAKGRDSEAAMERRRREEGRLEMLAALQVEPVAKSWPPPVEGGARAQVAEGRQQVSSDGMPARSSGHADFERQGGPRGAGDFDRLAGTGRVGEEGCVQAGWNEGTKSAKGAQRQHPSEFAVGKRKRKRREADQFDGEGAGPEKQLDEQPSSSLECPSERAVPGLSHMELPLGNGHLMPAQLGSGSGHAHPGDAPVHRKKRQLRGLYKARVEEGGDAQSAQGGGDTRRADAVLGGDRGRARAKGGATTRRVAGYEGEVAGPTRTENAEQHVRRAMARRDGPGGAGPHQGGPASRHGAGGSSGRVEEGTAHGAGSLGNDQAASHGKPLMRSLGKGHIPRNGLREQGPEPSALCLPGERSNKGPGSGQRPVSVTKAGHDHLGFTYLKKVRSDSAKRKGSRSQG